jgi:5-methyltetrahydrofolate--homocysteine methyltransferase
MLFDNWLNDDSKIILFDGGMGTEIFKRGIKLGKLPDLLNIEEPQVISEIHKAYYDAGSNMVQTNTFGSSYLNLQNYKLEDRINEINEKAIENIRVSCPNGALVVGDIGPSGHYRPPVGKITPEEWFQSYVKQVEILEKGVDLWHVETISDIEEMKATLEAIKKVSSKPIISSMTYKKTKRGFFTIMGDSLEKCITIQESYKVSVIGSNCTLGSFDMIDLLKDMKKITSLPISIKPNAGKPRLDLGGQTHYDQSIEEFADHIHKMIDLGVKIVGGCCGTSPKTIYEIKKIIKSISRS